jgi:hypothetical protein
MTTAAPRSDYEDSTKHLIAYGITGFAGVMLSTVAAFQILEGISALAKDDIYVKGLSYTYEFDVTTWGWIHLIIGIVALAVGIGIMFGQTWGHVAGLAVAFLSCLSSFTFLPYEPFWSSVILAFNAFVIWALCVRINNQDTW